MRSAMLLFLALTVVGCVPSPESASGQRSDLHRDVEGYAIASCLFHQKDPDLQRHGDAWASAVVQTSAQWMNDRSAVDEQCCRSLPDMKAETND